MQGQLCIRQFGNAKEWRFLNRRCLPRKEDSKFNFVLVLLNNAERIIIQNKKTLCQKVMAKLHCFRVLDIRHLKRGMSKMNKRYINVSLTKGNQFNGFQEVREGNLSGL